MNKNKIDEFFLKEEKWLREIIKAQIFLKKSKIEVGDLLSGLYMHIYKCKNEIKDEKTLKKYCSRFIMMECEWYNSKHNKQARCISDVHEDYIINGIEDIEDDLDDKIENERWYNECKWYLESYRQTITEKYKKIFFDVYFDFANQGKKSSVRKIAAHFNISNTSAHNMICDMKNDIKMYHSKNKQEIQNNNK